ncbi:MAG: hypothetical protein WCX73_01410 [Candidatus Pacearchaeota archaeon]|jgi:hypothetical protein
METQTKDRTTYQRVYGIAENLKNKTTKISIQGVASILGIRDHKEIKQSLEELSDQGILLRQNNFYIPNPKYQWSTEHN